MKSFFFLLLSVFSLQQAFAEECQVQLFSKVYRLSAGSSLLFRDLIKKSNCNPTVGAKLVSLISNAEGTVGADFLKSELAKDFPNLSIDFPNKKLSFFDLSDTLRGELLANTNLYITTLRSLNQVGSLGMEMGESLQITCPTCLGSGEKNIKIDVVNPVMGTAQTLWFSAKIMAKVKVVKAKRNISSQQKSLNPDDFFFEDVLVAMPDNVLTTLENIHFYKSNKNLLQGSIVSNLDLQPVNLLTFGTPAKVTLKNQNISLQKMAMPTRSARFGEVVELKGPGNKNISGKVIDYNQVVIEL